MNQPSAEPTSKPHWRALRAVALLTSLASVLLILRALPVEALRELLRSVLEGLGPWGPIAFVLIYIAATVAMLPASMLTLAGAAVFGFLVGYITVTIGSVVGAACAFLVARYVARRKVEEVAESYPKFAAIDRAISEGGWKIVALLRLSPAVPFNLQNYLYGLTSIRFWPYVLTSWLAMIPGTLMYVYLGHAAGQAVGTRDKTIGEWALLVVGLLATIAVTVYVTRLAKQKLAESSNLGETTATAPVPPRFPTRLVAVAVLLLAIAIGATLSQEAIAQYVQTLRG